MRKSSPLDWIKVPVAVAGFGLKVSGAVQWRQAASVSACHRFKFLSLMQFVKTRRHVMQEDATSSTDESRSKDEFYRQLSLLTDAMSAAHGRDFTVGTLILAARFIVQGKELGAASDSATSAA
jgi:triphosphoribosyl-dephospho-CoA synthetase